MVIESVNNERIKEIRKLKEKKHRDKEKKFLVEGEHLALEAYKSGNLETLIICDGYAYDMDVIKIFVTKDVIKSISELETPYNVIGICNIKENDEIGNKVLLLDNIQDPGNLGTIIRSAVAFNVDTIVLNNKSVDLYNSKVLRAAQGNNFYINIIRKDLIEFVSLLKKDGYKIYSTNVNNGNDVKNVKTNEKYAIIMGNEGNGVSADLQDLSDFNIYITMNDKCESLNVAVATSIILYELNK